MSKTNPKHTLLLLERIHRQRIEMLRGLYKLAITNVPSPAQQVIANEILLSIGREELRLEDILARIGEDEKNENEELPKEAS